MNTAMSLTGKSSNPITDWHNMCREVYGAIVFHRQRGKMVGTNDNPIQIDEARFTGRRKYSRGRMANADNALLSEDSDTNVQNNRNHGRRIVGPWVFALKQDSEC